LTGISQQRAVFDPELREAAGFAEELAILYATSLGPATCWYGH
jgi:hypothetical protein